MPIAARGDPLATPICEWYGEYVIKNVLSNEECFVAPLSIIIVIVLLSGCIIG